MRIEYLPTFYNDLLSTVSYIKDVLQNPIAAKTLVDDIEAMILAASESPDIYETYKPHASLKQEYHRIRVRNYFIIYYTKDNTMEISNLIYARSNILL